MFPVTEVAYLDLASTVHLSAKKFLDFFGKSPRWLECIQQSTDNDDPCCIVAWCRSKAWLDQSTKQQRHGESFVHLKIQQQLGP